MTTKAVGLALLLLGAGLAPILAHAQKVQPAVQSAAMPSEAVATPTRPLTAADLDTLRAELRSSRKQAVAQTLKLTDEEATRFWPVYDQYAAELTRIKDDQYKLIAEYANTYGKFDDKAATDFIRRWLDLDVRTTSLRAKYVPIVGKVLPGVKATTFFQIDRRVSMFIDLKIASLLPILQAQTMAR